VLHHLPEPRLGLSALRGCLAQDGVVAVMLYARHSRAGIDMLRALFARLGLGQDDRALALVRDCLKTLPAAHPAAHFLRVNERDLGFDAGLVDLFLNARERAYTVPDCLALLAECDLRFQGWYAQRAYHPDGHFASDAPLRQAIDALDPPAVWAAMELISVVDTGHHTFFACRPDRDPARYAIDFAKRGFLQFVPVLAPGTSATPADPAAGTAAVVRRQGASVQLDDNQVVLLRRVDGVRSIGEILKSAAPASLRAQAAGRLERIARDFFRLLWIMDIVQIRLKPAHFSLSPTGRGLG
jgi:hypothetical protein